MSDLVSVIISAYNHENYIQETIKSIISQTYQNIELLIIDDGSSDKTFEKINELKQSCQNRFVNFIAQTQENQGTCLTLNKLLELSKGKYIYIIASDDKASFDAIEVLHDFLSQNPGYAFAVGENLLIDSLSRVCYWDEHQKIIYNKQGAFYKSFTDFLRFVKRGSIEFLSEEFGSYESLLRGNYIPNGYLVTKSIFEKTGYFTPQAPLEDYYLMLQISKYSKMKFIPKPLFYYRLHDKNTAVQQEKMSAMTRDTLKYEISNVAKYENPEIRKILVEFVNELVAKK